MTTSVRLNVLELLNVHLTVGVGPPMEVQLMLTSFPSKTATSWFTTEVLALSTTSKYIRLVKLFYLNCKITDQLINNMQKKNFF